VMELVTAPRIYAPYLARSGGNMGMWTFHLGEHTWKMSVCFIEEGQGILILLYFLSLNQLLKRERREDKNKSKRKRIYSTR